MEKFVTHGGVKSFEEVVREVLEASRLRPKDEPAKLVAAVRPDSVELDPARYEVKELTAISVFNRDPVTVPTGPVGPTGFPYAPPGANGPAGPWVPCGGVNYPGMPIPTSPAPPGDRAEVELRQSVRRCLKEGVPLERMVEIFRLELIDVVHDD